LCFYFLIDVDFVNWPKSRPMVACVYILCFTGYRRTIRVIAFKIDPPVYRWMDGIVMETTDLRVCGMTRRRVSTTLRHSDMEFSEYPRLSFLVC
jgi:hypothetical protein